MSFFQTCISPNPLSPLSALNFNPTFNSSFSISPKNPVSSLPCDGVRQSRISKSLACFSVSREPSEDPGASSSPESKPKSRIQRGKEDDNPEKSFPTTRPRKPRRGRKSEAVAVEDYIRDKLEKTFESIRKQDPEFYRNREKVLKDGGDNWIDSDSSDEDEDEEEKMVVEEDDPDWPVDTDVGWGIRASEYFDQHPIKNVVGEDGVEIDWEGEMEDSWVKEINCLEWESLAFHPSPLMVLVFERYHRASLNWKTLKELEKAFKVYWNAKDRLPPRAVKLDINIERDLAYALKAKECPQILFLRGNKILYRESEFRTCDELVQMIAHFYYNAKRPSWINEAAKF